MIGDFENAEERDQSLYQEYKNGMLVSSLARKYQITQATVRKIVSLCKNNDPDRLLWQWFETTPLIPRR